MNTKKNVRKKYNHEEDFEGMNDVKLGVRIMTECEIKQE